MKIQLLAIGQRMPDWVSQGFNEYARRMPEHCRLELKEVAAIKRNAKADTRKITQREGEALLATLPKDCCCVALERSGKALSTEKLSQHMENWLQQGRDVIIMVGGPEGLSQACQQRADHVWSLSAMTFAHPLVRVMVAEQIYRASSILNNLPYHRGNG